MTRAGLITLALLTIAAGETLGKEFGPSFHIDECGWHAGAVVVVKALSLKLGTVEVIDTWTGDLRKGERLTLKELAVFADPAARAIIARNLADPDQVTGSRIILFLKRRPRTEDPSKPDWVPALRSVEDSTAWLEGSTLYILASGKRRDAVGFEELLITPTASQERVKEMARLRADVEKAAALPDPGKRATALRPFVKSEVYHARHAALEGLACCGKPALPVLRELLGDAALAPRHGDIVRSLARAGGPDSGAELTKLLEGELAFWKKIGPGLPAGWWNGANGAVPWDNVERLRNRYGRTLETIRGLRQARFAGGKATVTAFRDFWRSLPQLEDKSGLNQMSEECDGLLAELKK